MSSAKPMSSISSASSSTSTAHRVEIERAAPDVVQRAARRGDDDVGAALERADLLRHRRPAVQRHDGEPRAARVLVGGLGDLHGELARRHEHDPRVASRRGLRCRARALRLRTGGG